MTFLLVLLVGVAGAFSAVAQPRYQQPPREILEVLHAPVTPEVSISPRHDRLLLIERERYPDIAELAQPMLGLAGIRLNPQNFGPHRPPQNTGLILQTVPAGAQRAIGLPSQARFGNPIWSPDGKQFAFAMYLTNRIDLWLGNAENGKAAPVKGVVLNSVYGRPFQWMPDSRTLLCRVLPERRGAPPATPTAPPGPNLQESSGKPAPIRTFQDLLKDTHDEELFAYYATAQLLLVDTSTGRKRKLGLPDIFANVDCSPDGKYFLVTVLRKPFSRLLPAFGFPREVVVWDAGGQTIHTVAKLPSQEGVPIEGVPIGPRATHWRPTAGATLIWAEALDDGDPRKKAPHRDRLLSSKAPFQSAPTELLRLEHRYSGLTWGEHEGMAFVADYDRDRRWERTFLVRFDRPGAAPKLVWDRSIRDRYNDPGSIEMRLLPNGEYVIRQTGHSIYLSGLGASPRGDYPFLDRFDLETFKTERIFQSGDRTYESVVTLTEEKGALRFITRHESPSSPPNYLLRAEGAAKSISLTQFPDPTPQLRNISRQLVTYQRPDGVQLSFTLYLPAGHQRGQRLPTLVWAYPLEYNDPATAGQISGSTNRFTSITGASHLFFLMQGYAILNNATMPIVGTPEKMNDTFVDQIVSSAKAAIDKAVELGVTDPNRVGVGGHSYGAFMTANLLAHCDYFRAGIARSGAYNRTLTPFGFQGERRTFWEAPETYIRMSPFMQAHKINEPILLIHGERDDNSGTFPIQSERLFQAIKGNGGQVRYVTLPLESHGYAARQSIEHTLFEMISWFDSHVKNAVRPID